MTKTPLCLAALALACVSGAAQAHYLWIEQDASSAKVYFGEWQADLRETTDKVFKAIQGEVAFDADKKPLTIERKLDHLLIAQPGKGDVHVFDEVLHRGAKVVYEIRSGLTKTTPVATFEIVPTTPGGNTFTLMLDGKPLPEAEVTAYGPPKWEKPLHTDAKGQFTLNAPWAGFYVLHASYEDTDTKGEFEGKPFDKVINIAVLSFTQKKGIPWAATK